MFKKVLLAGALLLAPVLAYGASPSTDLSVQIVPAASPISPPSNGIACDIGPNYMGSIPAAAQAAGFTHCAANYDFTNSAYSNTATWLDCAGASFPQWTFYGDNPSVPCSRVFMTSDGGVQVLDIQYNPSTDGGTGSTNGTNSIQTSGSNNNSDISQALFTVPTGKYVEFVVRTDANLQNNNGCSDGCEMNDFWTWGGNGNPNFIEWDFLEEYSNTNGNGGIWHPWGGGNAGISGLAEPGQQGGYDPTQYHTYGFRIANDTSGDVAVCNYLDGTQLSNGTPPCATGNYAPVPLGREFLVLSSGPNSASNYAVTGNYYVKSVRVWECPGGASGECYSSSAQVTNNGALTGPP